MANVSMADTLILMVLALVVFGPRRLPQIGRQIGKLMYEFRKASNDFKFQMEEELRQAEEADRRKKEEEQRQIALAAAPPPAQIAAPAETPIQPAEPASIAPPPEPPPEIAAGVPYASTSTTGNPVDEPPIESAVEPTVGSPDVAPPSAESSPASSSAGSGEPSSFATPHPRIAPPSTGEKVAAAHPAEQPQQQNLFTGDSGKSPNSAAPDAENSEPATRHG